MKHIVLDELTAQALTLVLDAALKAGGLQVLNAVNKLISSQQEMAPAPQEGA